MENTPFNPTTAPNVANRPLTGPAVPPPGAQVPGAMAPAPAMAPDQTQLAQPAKDPQVLAAIAIYGYQLSSTNPVDVSMALSTLEGMGPQYRAEVNAAVVAQLKPGLDPMKTEVLLDYVARHKVREAVPMLQQLTMAGESRLRAAASQVYSDVLGLGANAAGVPQAPGAAPAGMPPGGPLPPAGPLPPELVGYLERLKQDGPVAAQAAVEIAQLPGPQMTAVVRAALDAKINIYGMDNLLSTILTKRVKEPGALDLLRQIQKMNGYGASQEAKMRAAVALIYHGTPQDLPDILRVVIGKDGGISTKARKLLIDALSSRPDMLNNPVTTTTLIATMNDRNAWPANIAAAKALSATRSAQARDALGASPIINDTTYNESDRVFVINLIGKHPGPFPSYVIDTLKKAEKDKEEAVAKAAKAMLKKIT